ncbi:PREDICTED: odorant receptor 85c-like isoform X2 [Vollenhovia emeryi]|uniref:odorant receptor 85c-like isoform X2 n=1 Tax=Vollenhovia emeryi TaxID=411798 RepID=UPI0005F455A7|nr:PREDICTED: odorant receptor 85c-like isoform X2 [Vollenhovia emeryi]
MNGTVIEKENPVATVFDHEKDIQLSIQLNRWMMELIGAWPKSTAISSIKRFAYALLNVICASLVSFLVIPTVIYIVLEMDDAYLILKLCGSLSFCTVVIVKYFWLLFHEKDIRNAMEHIKRDWMNTLHYDDRVVMIKSAKFGRRLVAICAFFIYGGAVFYCLVLPFSAGKITEDDGNLTYRPLIFPVARVIVDVRRSPINEIFFWVQCLAGFVAHFITASGYSLSIVLALHACGRMGVLIQWIEHLVDGREDLYNNMNERLVMIVEQHVQILRFISLTDKILCEISIIEIVQCTLNICLLGYYSIVEWESREITSYLTYFVLLLSFTFSIFMLCYIGELVIEKYKKIAEVSYMINWYRLSGKKSLALVLMIAMSNASIKLTAGNFFELSLGTFGDVIKTSVAYFNMLRTLNI